MQKRIVTIFIGIIILLFVSLIFVELWKPFLGKFFKGITGEAPLEGSPDYGSPDYCTCESLGYVCGIQTICDEQVDCGACGGAQYCLNGKCVAVRCTDSDAFLGYLSGINYYKKGITSAGTRFGSIDNCSDSILTEYFCSGSLVNWTFYNCSIEDKICEDGACIEEIEGLEEEYCGDRKCEGSIEATLNSGEYVNLSLNGKFYFIKVVVLGSNVVEFTINGKKIDLIGEGESESIEGSRIYVKEIKYSFQVNISSYVNFIIGENYESCSWDCGCNETDNGIDIYNKGKINYYFYNVFEGSYGWREATDNCNDRYLNEFSCEYYNPQEANPSKEFECIYGCWDGACLEFQEMEQKKELKEAYCGDGKCWEGEERNIKKGESLKYFFNNKEYNIFISSHRASEIILNVNGKLTNNLEIGESEVVDDLLIYLKNIWYIYSDFSFESVDIILGESAESCPTDCVNKISEEEERKSSLLKKEPSERKEQICGDKVCDKGKVKTLVSGESINFDFQNINYKIKAAIIDEYHANVSVNEQSVGLGVFESRVIDGLLVYVRNIEYSGSVEIASSIDFVLGETAESCPEDCISEGVVREFYKGVLVKFIKFLRG